MFWVRPQSQNPAVAACRVMAASPRIVNATASPPARRLLATVLGDLVQSGNAPAWNGAIVDVLGLLGVEGAAVRQALARAAGHDFVVGTRVGRSTRWSLTPRGHRFIEGGFTRLREFEAGAPPWDREWIVLLTSVSGSDRTVRRRLYARLVQLRFGNPAPGTWVSPWVDQLPDVRAVLAEYQLETTSQLFVGRNVGYVPDPELAGQSWDLEALATTYRDAIERYAHADPRTDEEVLVQFVTLRTEVMTAMWADPALPPELTPDRSGREFAQLSHELAGRWRPTAEAVWQALVAKHEPAAHRNDDSRLHEATPGRR